MWQRSVCCLVPFILLPAPLMLPSTVICRLRGVRPLGALLSLLCPSLPPVHSWDVCLWGLCASSCGSPFPPIPRGPSSLHVLLGTRPSLTHPLSSYLPRGVPSRGALPSCHYSPAHGARAGPSFESRPCSTSAAVQDVRPLGPLPLLVHCPSMSSPLHLSLCPTVLPRVGRGALCVVRP